MVGTEGGQQQWATTVGDNLQKWAMTVDNNSGQQFTKVGDDSGQQWWATMVGDYGGVGKEGPRPH